MTPPLSSRFLPLPILILTVLSMIGLSGCVHPHQPLPLYTSRSVIGRFGYAEQQQPEADRWRVVYLTPEQSTYSRPGTSDRTSEEAALKHQAHDLATWRAADLAQSHGFKGFHIVDSRTDIGAEHFEHDYIGHAWPQFGGNGGYFGTGGMSWGSALGQTQRETYDWGDAGYIIQAQETLLVSLSNTLGDGDYDATAMIAQLRAAYPGQEGTIPELDATPDTALDPAPKS